MGWDSERPGAKPAAERELHLMPLAGVNLNP
jgi:hypothetical protein